MGIYPRRNYIPKPLKVLPTYDDTRTYTESQTIATPPPSFTPKSRWYRGDLSLAGLQDMLSAAGGTATYPEWYRIKDVIIEPGTLSDSHHTISTTPYQQGLYFGFICRQNQFYHIRTDALCSGKLQYQNTSGAAAGMLYVRIEEI